MHPSIDYRPGTLLNSTFAEGLLFPSLIPAHNYATVYKEYTLDADPFRFNSFL